MKKASYIIIALFLLLNGCATYWKLSGVDKKIEDTMEESLSLAALAITYHQANRAWPTSSDELHSYFSNITLGPTMSIRQNMIDGCLYYLNEIHPIEFDSNSYDNLTLTYKNYKNRDVWVYLSYDDSNQNGTDKKNYLFSVKIQIPSNADTTNKTVPKKSYLSQEQIDFIFTLIFVLM